VPKQISGRNGRDSTIPLLVCLAILAVLAMVVPAPLRLDVILAELLAWVQPVEADNLASAGKIFLVVFIILYGLFLVPILVFLFLMIYDKIKLENSGKASTIVKKSANQVLFLSLMVLFFSGLVAFAIVMNRPSASQEAATGLVGPAVKEREAGDLVANLPADTLVSSGAGSPAALRREAAFPIGRLLPWLAGLVCLLLVLGIVAPYLILLHRRARVAADAKTDNSLLDEAQADLSEHIEQARQRLHKGDDARDAIIDCYADMCLIFSGGIAETPDGSQALYLTAREFRARLAVRGITLAEVGSLTSLFEKARYSDQPCTDNDRADAARALQAISRHLQGLSGTTDSPDREGSHGVI